MDAIVNQEKKVSPKDVFSHLLAIVTLYTSAVTFLMLVFEYINVLIPDMIANGGYYSLQSSYDSIRRSIASLVVVFPVYILTSWFLGRNYATDPAKRNLRIRKWLIYFTLFVTALIIIGDLVALIYNLLGGEITLRFILKIIAVFFVAGSIFIYYFWDVRRHNVE